MTLEMSSHAVIDSQQLFDAMADVTGKAPVIASYEAFLDGITRRTDGKSRLLYEILVERNPGEVFREESHVLHAAWDGDYLALAAALLGGSVQRLGAKPMQKPFNSSTQSTALSKLAFQRGQTMLPGGVSSPGRAFSEVGGQPLVI
ncbi:MAG: hypothetical protein CBARDCOR_4002 [uncultured Caballeronia sp.]|nr:MAG: hypothetical protein CBARDCOR_4002 [uncultured Caballeronia sp.]